MMILKPTFEAVLAEINYVISDLKRAIKILILGLNQKLDPLY
jgi:hypothetical protein